VFPASLCNLPSGGLLVKVSSASLEAARLSHAVSERAWWREEPLRFLPGHQANRKGCASLKGGLILVLAERP